MISKQRIWSACKIILKLEGKSMQAYLDSQEGLPTSFENEVMGWLPENGHNHTQMFGSDPCVPLRYDFPLFYFILLFWDDTKKGSIREK